MTLVVVKTTINVMSNSFGERLRKARLSAGLSARGLDKKAGITRGHTSLIEAGVRPNVELKTARALADALGVSLDWLVSESKRDSVPPPPPSPNTRAA